MERVRATGEAILASIVIGIIGIIVIVVVTALVANGADVYNGDVELDGVDLAVRGGEAKVQGGKKGGVHVVEGDRGEVSREVLEEEQGLDEVCSGRVSKG